MEWINIKDELPENEDWYLCSVQPKYKGVPNERVKEDCVIRKYSAEDGFDNPMFNEITHWMPLPEPPTADKED